MKIKMVILDNDEEYGKDISELISSYTEDFYRELSTPITQIEALHVSTSTDAFDLIKTGDIDILSLDIELDNNERGDEAYEKLFFDGVSVPAIVVSAVVDTEETETRVIAKGVSSIIHIARGDKDVAERLATEVCRVLCDRNLKMQQIQRYVQIQGIDNDMMTHNSKEQKNYEWINSMLNGNHSPIEEKEILAELTRECGNKTRSDEDHNIGFMRSD